MTAKRRRDLTNQLHREAAVRGLQAEHREVTRGKWRWDIRDEARGTLALRGVSLQEAATYVGLTAYQNDNDPAAHRVEVTTKSVSALHVEL